MTTGHDRRRQAALAARAAVVASVAAVAAACGAGGDTTGSSTAAPTSLPPPTTAAVESGRLALVVDTDLASDDIVALAYLSAHPDVDLLAVTVTGTGEVRCPRGADVAAGLLAVLGEGDVPVACGPAEPLAGDREFPVEWRDAADDAYGLPLRTVRTDPDGPDAPALLIETVDGTDRPVTLLTLGPLTNVATALRREPGLLDAVDRVVVMGGALDVAGNVQPDPDSEPLAAEWNLYIDPVATAEVVAATRVELVGLDATNTVPVDVQVVDRIIANDTTAASAYVVDLVTSRPPPYLWDPLAAVVATDPHLVSLEPASVRVVTHGEDAGATRRDVAGAPTDVADVPDAAAVLDHLIRTLAGLGEDEPLVTPTSVAPVGTAVIRFDGTSCAYEGPTVVSPGALEVRVEGGDDPFAAVVARLVSGATLDEAVQWSIAHPGETPPIVDQVAVVGAPGTAAARVDLLPGDHAVVCTTPDGGVVPAAVVTAR